MKRQFRFTKRSLDALPPCPANSASKEIEWSDLDIGGLRVQVNHQGRKTFLFRYQIDGRKRAMKVGRYPETTIEEARQKVIEWRALLAKGIDPQESRDTLRETQTSPLRPPVFSNPHRKTHAAGDGFRQTAGR